MKPATRKSTAVESTLRSARSETSTASSKVMANTRIAIKKDSNASVEKSCDPCLGRYGLD